MLKCLARKLCFFSSFFLLKYCFIFLECCFPLFEVMVCRRHACKPSKRMFFGVAVAKHKEPTFINILRPQLNYAWKTRKVLICNSVPRVLYKQRCCLQILAKFFNIRCSQDLNWMNTIIKLIIYTLRMFFIMF